MSKVFVYYHKLDDNAASSIDEVVINKWLSELSDEKSRAVTRLINEHDQKLSLLGLHLLKRCADDIMMNSFVLSDIYYPQQGKPIWIKKPMPFFDFNISHSDNLIVVACSEYMDVGIDVEKIKPLKRLNFKMVLNEGELEKIQQKQETFFEYWAIKEAVVKAANTTGIARMRDVNLFEDSKTAELDGKRWKLKKLDAKLAVENEYAVYLASEEQVKELIIEQINLDELISPPSEVDTYHYCR